MQKYFTKIFVLSNRDPEPLTDICTPVMMMSPHRGHITKSFPFVKVFVSPHVELPSNTKAYKKITVTILIRYQLTLLVNIFG